MKLKIYAAASLVALTCAAHLQAEDIVFQGRVVNTQGIPLSGAEVVAIGASTGVRTGVDGVFRLALNEADTVTISKEGLSPFKQLVDYNYRGVVVLGPSQASWLSYAEYVRQMSATAQTYCDAGLTYLAGEDGGQPDQKKALACFWRAAGMEYPLGYYYLGTMLEEGKGASQNRDAAIANYQKAVGIADAHTRLGALYAAAEDYKAAARYYGLAAEEGDSAVARPALEQLLAQGLAAKEDLEDTHIYEVVETPALFPGGNEACMQWLARNVRYPRKAMEQGITGHVLVSFVVNTDGAITDVEVMKSPDPSLAAEAVRVINAMPQWQPAYQAGKPVRSRFSIPIMFNLS